MEAEDRGAADESVQVEAQGTKSSESGGSSQTIRGEFRWIALWILLLVGISTAPYILGYCHSTEEWRFTGHLLPVPGDTCFHMSWAKQAADGDVLFESKHNGATSNTRMVFNLLFLSIGWTSRLLHLPLEMGWQIVRVGIAILLFLTLYQFTSLFFSDRRWKWIALVWTTTAAGFSWLEMLRLPNWWRHLGNNDRVLAPIDLYVSEVSTFWHMRWEVVTTPTVLLLLAAFLFALRDKEVAKGRSLGLAALMCLLMGFVHPHNLMTIYGALVIHLLMDIGSRRLGRPAPAASWRPWIQLLVMGAAAIPAVAYYAYMLYREPVLWRYVAAQYHFGLLPLLGGYGLPSLFAIWGIFVIIRRGEYRFYFLIAWLLCGLLVLYVPIPPAGRVHGIDGLHITFCLLGTRGLMSCCAWMQQQTAILKLGGGARRVAGVTALITLLVVSSLGNVLRVVNELVMSSRRGMPPFLTVFMASGITQQIDNLGEFVLESKGVPYFLPRDLLEACAWLNEHAASSDVVLAPDYVTTYIPYLAGNRVYYGHGYVTPEMMDRRAQVKRFYSFEQSDAVRQAFLRSERIDYVLFWSGDPVSDAESAQFQQLVEQSHPLRLVQKNSRMLIFETTFRNKSDLSSAESG